MPTVLVVDTEVGICNFIALALQQKGFSVLIATNAMEALSIGTCLQDEIGLVIAEMNMPIIDGPTLARALVSNQPGMPFLFMSSDYSVPGTDELQRFDILAKPFSLDTLLDQVQSLLPDGQTSIN